MDAALVFYTSLCILLVSLIYKVGAPRRHHLPPSPAVALPLLGHLLLLKSPLHRHYHRLARISGPIFSLKLGVRRCVVVSSPSLAGECFTTNDIVLANRPRFLVDKYIGYGHRTLVGVPYGEQWRSLRRVASQELLSAGRLNEFLHIRQDEINRLLLSIYRTSGGGCCSKAVELRLKLSELTFNVVMRMVAGKRYFSEDESERGHKFLKLINDFFEVAHASTPQDFLPFLQWIDYGGFKKKLASLAKQVDQVLQNLVDEHRQGKIRNTLIEHLLFLQESHPEFYPDQTIKALVLTMLFAGTDTSSVTIEWAISVLLNHPHVLEKARAELETKVGNHRLISEEDLPNLPYLRNVILETFRLFPAAPLLLPHEASEDCRVGGYDIPRGTILFINAWAIHRDPGVWEEPTRFKPERFEGKEVEAHKLMAFGMGRRACPGAGLAQRVVGLALGSMIQCFEWERVSSEEVDLAEGVGLTMPKLKPLEVMCRPREIMFKVFQEASTISRKLS